MPWIKESTIKSGTFFTVDKWKHRDDRSWKGDVLEALAVSGNYVRVKNHTGVVKYHTLDLREVSVLELTNQFVDSVLTTTDPQEQK